MTTKAAPGEHVEVLTSLYERRPFADAARDLVERLGTFAAAGQFEVQRAVESAYCLGVDKQEREVVLSWAGSGTVSAALERGTKWAVWLRVDQAEDGSARWQVAAPYAEGKLLAQAERFLAAVLPRELATGRAEPVRVRRGKTSELELIIERVAEQPAAHGTADSAAIVFHPDNPLGHDHGGSLGIVAKARHLIGGKPMRPAMGPSEVRVPGRPPMFSASLPNTLGSDKGTQEQRARAAQLMALFKKIGKAWTTTQRSALERYRAHLVARMAQQSRADVVQLKLHVTTDLREAAIRRVQADRDQARKNIAKLELVLNEFVAARTDADVANRPDPEAVAVLKQQLNEAHRKLSSFHDEMKSGAEEPSVAVVGHPTLDVSELEIKNVGSLTDRRWAEVIEALVGLGALPGLPAADVGNGRRFDALDRVHGNQIYERRVGKRGRIYFARALRETGHVWTVLLINGAKTAAGQGVKDREYEALCERLRARWSPQ